MWPCSDPPVVKGIESPRVPDTRSVPEGVVIGCTSTWLHRHSSEGVMKQCLMLVQGMWAWGGPESRVVPGFPRLQLANLGHFLSSHATVARDAVGRAAAGGSVSRRFRFQLT